MGGLILGAAANSQLPAFMQERVKDENDELMSKFLVPPRIKVMQPTKSDAFSEFDYGEAVLMPMKVSLAETETPWHFVPLLFYPEYLVVNPLELKDTLPMIRERTIDPNSEIAAICRNPDRRKAIPCPDNAKYNLSYVESLVFITVIANKPQVSGLPVAMTFSGGEHRVGSQLVGKIKARGAPRYGCIFEAFVPKKKRTNSKGSWFGIDIQNPTAGEMPAFVQDKDEYDKLKAQSETLLEQYKNSLITVDYDDDAAGEDAAAAAANDVKY